MASAALQRNSCITRKSPSGDPSTQFDLNEQTGSKIGGKSCLDKGLILWKDISIKFFTTL